MGSVSAVHWGNRNEHKGSACRRIGQLRAAYRRRVLCFDNVRLLLYRHPQIFRTIWRDRCQTHTTGYRTASTGVGGDEENHRQRQQLVSHSRHRLTMLSRGRPPEPAVNATVYRVLSLQRGRIL